MKKHPRALHKSQFRSSLFHPSFCEGHGVMSGECVSSDRAPLDVCEIQSWCPVEIDRLPMDPKTEGPLITGMLLI